MLGCQGEARKCTSVICPRACASPGDGLNHTYLARGSTMETIMDYFPQKTSIKAAANSFFIFVIFRKKRSREECSVDKALLIQA